MEPTTQIDLEPTRKRWPTSLIAILLVGVVFCGALLAVRDEAQTAARAQAIATRDALEPLSKKLSALEGRLAMLESAPKPDLTALDGLRADVSALQATASQLQERATALEKKPVLSSSASPASAAANDPVKSSPQTVTSTMQPGLTSALKMAVLSGLPYQMALEAWEKAQPGNPVTIPVLRRYAAAGLVTDASLRSQFQEIAEQLTKSAPETAEASPFLSRINTHLAGLISIHKTADHVAELTKLAQGNESLTPEQLAAKINALPSDLQTPFASWKAAFASRNAALAELASLPLEGSK